MGETKCEIIAFDVSLNTDKHQLLDEYARLISVPTEDRKVNIIPARSYPITDVDNSSFNHGIINSQVQTDNNSSRSHKLPLMSNVKDDICRIKVKNFKNHTNNTAVQHQQTWKTLEFILIATSNLIPSTNISPKLLKIL